jgi:predicted nucleotide-binding protein (sugar kinase/HSP70/actin superfamily)
VVAAFERITGKAVTVPPHHEVTGAIGAAILAMRERNGGPSAFKGFDLSKRSYTVSTFQCAECANRCDIRRVSFDGEQPLFYGSRCEKYDVKRRAPKGGSFPDLFAERERILAEAVSGAGSATGPSVGIPRSLYLNDFLPYWTTFFAGLGFSAVPSGKTTRSLVNRGLEASAAETCFPAKAGLGHVLDLIDKNVDVLFLPSFVRLPAHAPELKVGQACPYAQAMPYLAKAAVRFNGVKLLDPALQLHEPAHWERSVRALGRSLGKSAKAARDAHAAALRAQERFEHALKEKGREVLSSLKEGERALVLVGRTYNACDPGTNMNLPSKIRDLGVKAIPMDFLPLHQVGIGDIDNLYWRSGQKIMAAARFIRDHRSLFPVYITNFGCGPDSFISHFFKEEMGGKPFLQLEIDEHSADAGAVTRIEAFLDSLKNVNGSMPTRAFTVRSNGPSLRRKVFFPFMADHAHVVAAAFRACGVESEVLPESDEETVRIGKKYSSGRECFPLALTTGDMIKATRRRDFDPGRSAFFMPTGKGPCRFGQYNRYHRMVLDSLGLRDVPIVAPMQDEGLYREIGVVGKDLVRLTWNGVVAIDMLQKALRESRPYEKNKGEADSIYGEALRAVAQAVTDRQDLRPVLRKAYRDFSSLAITERDKPVIGIVGEIYIRGNRFGNEDIVAKVEALGGEAWVAPLGEWMLYLSATAKVSARMNRAWKDLVKAHLTHWVQVRDEHRLMSAFNGNLRSLHEPTIEETLRRALPYVHHSFEGEAVLSVGKAVDYIRRGVSGVVNVMPFSCMPGTITNGLLKRLREDFGNIPFLNIAYEGQQDTQTVTRLEAFMHQAREYQRVRKSC